MTSEIVYLAWDVIGSALKVGTVSLLNLDALRVHRVYCFLVIIRYSGDFDQTTRRLRVRQPPLDRQVHTLRGHLRISLFSQQRQPIHLAPTNRMFLTGMRPTLTRLRRTVTRARRTTRNRVNRLAVKLSDSTTGNLFSSLLHQFYRHRPRIAVDLRRLAIRRRLTTLTSKRVSLNVRTVTPTRLTSQNLS